MIRVLLFLRAWHAELRLWKHGMRHSIGVPGALSEERLHAMADFVNRCWVDFSTGYIKLR